MLSEISNDPEFARLAVKAEGIKDFEGGNTSERKEKRSKICHITNAIHAQIDRGENIDRL